MSSGRKAMGARINGHVLKVLGWVTTIVMGIAAVALVVLTLVG